MRLKAPLIPETQVLEVLLEPEIHQFCGVQKMYPGKFGEPKRETSGLNRAGPCPESVTVCQEG